MTAAARAKKVSWTAWARRGASKQGQKSRCEAHDRKKMAIQCRTKKTRFAAAVGEKGDGSTSIIKGVGE